MESQGDLLRDEALERVEKAAPLEWKDFALRAVWLICVQVGPGGGFTTDRVWAVLERGLGVERSAPPEPRAMGAIMMKAKRLRFCEPTDRTKKSVRPDCHGRPVRIWKSLVGH